MLPHVRDHVQKEIKKIINGNMDTEGHNYELAVVSKQKITLKKNSKRGDMAQIK